MFRVSVLTSNHLNVVKGLGKYHKELKIGDNLLSIFHIYA